MNSCLPRKQLFPTNKCISYCCYENSVLKHIYRNPDRVLFAGYKHLKTDPLSMSVVILGQLNLPCRKITSRHKELCQLPQNTQSTN
jgi:hypothetical protein